MSKVPSKFIVQFIILIGLVLVVASLGVFRTADNRIQLAEESYRKGEAATTIAERKEAFNSALDLFLQLNTEYHPNFGNGKLSYNIGNTYFQLGEYPLSILYYKRAENLMPRSELVKRNLMQAREKVGLKTEENKSLLDFLLLKSYFSLPERLQAFFILAIIVILIASAWFWTRKHWISNIGGVFLLLLVALLINLGVSYYFSPIEAVLVKAAELRRDAGMEFAKVGDEPISGGTTLQVINTSPNGKWLKVSAPGGEFGYVPSESVKLVDL